MAAGDRIFMAKESTSQEILSNTKKIIEDAKAKPKRYGMRINLLDSNPATRVKYLYDAVGMTPAGMNFAGGGFDYGDWGDIWFVKKNRPVMVRTDGTVDYELNHENHALKLNGGASDITKTSYGGNAMSEIPLIWVKRWTQNNYHFVVFCERACCHSGTVTQELSQETGRRTTFRPITGGQGTGKNQPHRKEAIHENDRTGTTHQNPASEKNVPDKGAKRET